MRDPQPSAALYEMLEEIGVPSSLHECLSILDERLRALLPFQSMTLFLPEEGSLEPVYRSRAGAAAPEAPGRSVARRVAASGRPAFNCDPRETYGEVQAPSEFRSMLAVPLDDGQELVAVLALHSVEERAFDPSDLGAMLWFSADMARAIRHARWRDGLLRLAAAVESDPAAAA